MNQLLAEGRIEELAAANIRRAIMHTEAEISWHDDFDAELASEMAHGGGEPAMPRGELSEIEAHGGGEPATDSRRAGHLEKILREYLFAILLN